MNNKITLQDIADALGLSRNTVSRALNNPDAVSDATRDKIFQTALEMGYKHFLPASSLDASPVTPPAANDIALFTNAFPGRSHFGNKLLDAFQQKAGSFGYKLSIYIVRDVEIEQLRFPAYFQKEQTAGILCMELFSDSYASFLCGQDIPLLFIDTVFNPGTLDLQADILYMENQVSVYGMLKELIRQGRKNISFVGDRFHCHSFYERWQAYCAVLADHNIPFSPEYCILEPDSSLYNNTEWLSQRIRDLPAMPNVFFCANDYLATSLLKALKYNDLSVPEDVFLCGFDDAPEADLVEPALTTVQIPSSDMGLIAADLLLSRISHPDMPYRTTYVKTKIIYRDSTKNFDTT